MDVVDVGSQHGICMTEHSKALIQHWVQTSSPDPSSLPPSPAAFGGFTSIVKASYLPLTAEAYRARCQTSQSPPAVLLPVLHATEWLEKQSQNRSWCSSVTAVLLSTAKLSTSPSELLQLSCKLCTRWES